MNMITKTNFEIISIRQIGGPTTHLLTINNVQPEVILRRIKSTITHLLRLKVGASTKNHRCYIKHLRVNISHLALVHQDSGSYLCLAFRPGSSSLNQWIAKQDAQVFLSDNVSSISICLPDPGIRNVPSPGSGDPKPWCDPSSTSTSSTPFHLDLSVGGKACDKQKNSI